MTTGLHFLRAQDGLTIYVYDDIDTQYGFSAKDLSSRLEDVPTNTPITIRINSAGGNVWEAMAIYNLLRQWQGTVTTVCDGLAASAASLVFLAGDVRKIYENAQVMVHNPHLLAMGGDADDLTAAAETVRQMEITYARIYSERTGQSQAQCRDWMRAETFFSAGESLSYGFATEILNYDSGRMVAQIKQELIAMTANANQNQNHNTNNSTNIVAQSASWEEALRLHRDQLAREDERVEGIRASYDVIARQRGGGELNQDYLLEIGCRGTTLGELRAHAIRSGWDRDRFELEARRAGVPSIGPAICTGTGPYVPHDNPRVLQAAVGKMMGWSNASFDDRTREAADQIHAGHILDLAELHLRANGRWASHLKADRNEFFRLLRAEGSGPSSSSFTYLLGDAANKEAAQLYQAMPSVARKISRKLTAKDFKQHHVIGSVYDAKLEQLGADGEIVHSDLGERSATYSVNTYAKMVTITRRDLMNDDLDLLKDFPRKFAYGTVTTIEKMFWELVLSNPSSWFAADNDNYIDGSATVMGIDGVSAAVQAMAEMQDDDGDPIMTSPKFLVVGPANYAAAKSIYAASEIVTGEDTTLPNHNPWKAQFEPLMSPWIGAAAGLTGGTDTLWFLFSDPNVLGATGIASIDGREAPILEAVDLGADRLGEGWRAYVDVGVCLLEKKAAIMSKGAA